MLTRDLFAVDNVDNDNDFIKYFSPQAKWTRA